MRAKNKARLAAIRLMLAEIKKIEVDERIEVSDDRVISILDKMMKQRRESIRQYESGNRQDLADVEQAEIEVIMEFMPSALDESEITKMIEEAINEIGAVSIKEMGAVMNIVRPKVMGRSDMGMVSGLVKSRLS